MSFIVPLVSTLRKYKDLNVFIIWDHPYTLCYSSPVSSRTYVSSLCAVTLTCVHALVKAMNGPFSQKSIKPGELAEREGR